MTQRALLLRRAQHVVVALLIAWVAVHTVIVWRTGWSAWRLGGLGMYTEAGYNRAASIVACAEDDCAEERRDIDVFAPVDYRAVPVLRSKDGNAPYELVDARALRGSSFKVFSAFQRFPSSWNARSLVQARLDDPCGTYLVAWYRQRVSLLSRKAWVVGRSYVVVLPSGKHCSDDDRVRA